MCILSMVLAGRFAVRCAVSRTTLLTTARPSHSSGLLVGWSTDTPSRPLRQVGALASGSVEMAGVEPASSSFPRGVLRA